MQESLWPAKDEIDLLRCKGMTPRQKRILLAARMNRLKLVVSKADLDSGGRDSHSAYLAVQAGCTGSSG